VVSVRGTVIGFEKLNFSRTRDQNVDVAFETISA